jgi:hypothetical protein
MTVTSKTEKGMENYPAPQVARSNVMASLMARRPQIVISETYDSGDELKSVSIDPSPGQAVLLDRCRGLCAVFLRKSAAVRVVDSSNLEICLDHGCVASVELLRCKSVSVRCVTPCTVSAELCEGVRVDLVEGDSKVVCVGSQDVQVSGSGSRCEVSCGNNEEILVHWNRNSKEWIAAPLERDHERGGVPIFAK